jgi:hypothetical protein
MTQEEQQNFLNAVSVYVREQVAQQVAEALEKADRERHHKGTWQEGQTYRKHNSVMYGGSSWICVCDSTTLRPSTDEPLVWQLACKHGRDGRDGRAASHRSGSP